MKTVNAIKPTHDQFAELVSIASDDPIHMVNLLKFREKAVYPDGRDADLSGREAYMRYGRAMTRLVRDAGGAFTFNGQVEGLLIGDVEDLWDAVAILVYPSAKAMGQITQSPEFAEIAPHRKAGLAGQLLIRCSEQPVPA